MALDEDQIHLVGTGRNLLMGVGTRFDVQDSFNPFQTQVRTPQSMDRPYAHGALVGAEWMAERVVPIRVIANGEASTVPLARAAVQDMAAAFAAVGATGETAELRFRLAEDPDEFVVFGRPRGIEPDMSTLALGYSYVSTAFVANDPRIYSGELTTQSTGLPVQQGGLTIPGTPASTRLRAPGTVGAYASTPDHASLDITGDLEVEFDIDPVSWATGASQTIAAKLATGQRSFTVSIRATGELGFGYSTDGSNLFTRVSTAPVPFGGRRQGKVEFDADNGSAGHTVRFYTRTPGAATWTQLGSSVVTAGVVTMFSSSSPLEIASAAIGTGSFMPGTVYSLTVRSGIGGTIVANPDFTTRTPGATSFADSTGKTWTVHGGAALVGGTAYRGGLTHPFTIPGYLVGGELTLENTGTTSTGLTVRIDGPAPGPRLVLIRADGTVQSIAFDLTLAAGQWLEVDTAARTALLNGLASANQRGVASWDMDPYPVQPGINTLRFASSAYNATAQITTGHRSAWW